MTWLLRCIVWATLLAPACYLAMPHYQRLLVRTAGWLLAQVGIRVAIRNLQLYEPAHLGLFAAMCLASSSAPRAARVRALALGLPALALFGLLLVVGVIAAYGTLRVEPPALQALILNVVSATLESIPWLSAPLLWAVLLGRWELSPRSPAGHATDHGGGGARAK